VVNASAEKDYFFVRNVDPLGQHHAALYAVEKSDLIQFLFGINGSK